MSDKQPENNVGFFKVLLSAMAALFGVQSNRNYERDFGKGKAGAYIVAGIILTVLFILTLVTVVSMVMESAG